MPSHLFQKNKVLILLLGFTAGLFLLTCNPSDNRPYIFENILREIRPYPDSLVDSTTSLKRYLQISDSLKDVEQIKKWRLMVVGDGWGINFFGLKKVKECDTCTSSLSQLNKSLLKEKYFFHLNDYTLKDPSSSFIIENGKYYIKTQRFVKRNGNIDYYEDEKKEIKVRLGAEFHPYEKSTMSLYIPISRTAYKFLDIFLQIIFIPLLLILIWISFILPIKTLFRISMGDSFNIKNIKNLRLAGWTIIATVFFPVIISVIVRVLMGATLPAEIHFPTFLYINDKKGWLIGGICLLIIASALKSGLKIKEEQELTV